MPTMRLFFALWPSPQAATDLATIAVETAARIGGRPMREETIHLTLAFLGKVPEERAPELLTIGESLRTPAFDLRIDQLGYWRHNHLLWAGCSDRPRKLVELADGLCHALSEAGFSIDNGKRAFTPHITLVRKVPEPGPKPGLPAIGLTTWTCTEFVLVRSRLSSDGPNYEVLARFPLGTE